MKKEWVCYVCGCTFKRYEQQVRNKEEVCCSRKCNSIKIKESEKLKGKNNPNYGNRWNDTQKRKASELKKEQFDNTPEYRYNVGKSNRGKILSDDVKHKMSNSRLGKGNAMYGKTHSDDAKEKIGKASSDKFTDEYNKKMKTIMVNKGYWVDDELKSDWEIYNKESYWIERMFDRANEKELELLNEYKVFNSQTNTNGVVRDHNISRRYGFENKIFPEILRHPCNCQLILHSENCSKKSGNCMDIDTLFDNIINYKGDWCEQNICEKRIDEYKKGKRWSRH